jgi:hypothetical protein
VRAGGPGPPGCQGRGAGRGETAISHNLTRVAGTLAGTFHARARGATIRRHLINVAARIARHGVNGRGHITLHLPEGWHRDQEWLSLFEAACGPPAQAACDQPGTSHRAS